MASRAARALVARNGGSILSKRAPRDAEATSIRATTTAQILAAAERVFAEHGFAGATMAQIAAASGLPKANLHYYFGTKERLYRAVLEGILALWLAQAAAWITPDRPPAEAIAGYVRAKMEYSRTRPEASRIFAGELLRGAPTIMDFLRQELRARVRAMAGVLEGWMAQGVMDRLPPAHLLFAIWAMTQTYADFAVQMQAVLDTGRLSEAEYARGTATVVRLVLKGCGIDARHPSNGRD